MKSDLKRSAKIWIALFIYLWKSLSITQAEEVPTAIFHAFDTKLIDLGDQLCPLSEQGYTHIQISPILKSRTTLQDADRWRATPDIWWLAYQPTSILEFGNKYGTEKDLKEFIEKAHSCRMKVIVDLVLNHMASIDNLTSRDWKKAYNLQIQGDSRLMESYLLRLDTAFEGLNRNDFHPWKWAENTDEDEETWLTGFLPDLKTDSQKVLNLHFEQIKKFLNLGVDGFRFDATRHIRLENLKQYVAQIPETHWKYFEYAETQSPEKSKKHSEVAPITDFYLLRRLIEIFAYQGSLSELSLDISNGFSDSLTFAVNHDTYANQIDPYSGINMHFPDRKKDAELATLFLLGRKEGVPLLLAQIATGNPDISAGVLFRSQMNQISAPKETFLNAQQLCPHCSNQIHLFMHRGQSGIFVLNKSAYDLVTDFADVTNSELKPGCFENVKNAKEKLWIFSAQSKTIIKTSEHNFTIPKRSGAFYRRVFDCN